MAEPGAHGHPMACTGRRREDAPHRETHFQRGPGSAERRSRTLAAAAVAAQRPDVSRETVTSASGHLPGSTDTAASRRRRRPSSLRLPSAESTSKSWDSAYRPASITPSDLPPQRSRPRVADATGSSGRDGPAAGSRSLSRAARLSLQQPQPAPPPRGMRGVAGPPPPPPRRGSVPGPLPATNSQFAGPGWVASSRLALGIEDITSKMTGLASPRTCAAPPALRCSDGTDPAPMCAWPEAGRGAEMQVAVSSLPAAAGRTQPSPPPPRSAPSPPRAVSREKGQQRSSLLAQRRRGDVAAEGTRLSLGAVAGSDMDPAPGRRARRRPNLALSLDFDATAAPLHGPASPVGGGEGLLGPGGAAAGQWDSVAGSVGGMEGPRAIDARAGEQRRMQGVLSRVGPSLFVTGEAGASRAAPLAENGVTHVVNCAGTAVRTADEVARRMRILTLRVLDAGDECLLPYLPATLAFLQEAAAGGGSAAVHCAMGVSRSSAFAVADIMLREGLSADDAFRSVRRTRSVACPNPGFHFQLVEWGAARPGRAASSSRHNAALLYRVRAYLHRREGAGSAPPGALVHLGAEWLPLLEGPVQLSRADGSLPTSLFRPRTAAGEVSLPDNDAGCANAGFNLAECDGAAGGSCSSSSPPAGSPSLPPAPPATGRHASQRRTQTFFPDSDTESSGLEGGEEEEEEEVEPDRRAPSSHAAEVARVLPAASEALGGEEVSPAYVLVHRGRCCTLRSTQTPPLLSRLSRAGTALLHQVEGVEDASCSLVWDGGRREWEVVGATEGQGPFVREDALTDLLDLAVRTAHQVEINPKVLDAVAPPPREATEAWLALTQAGHACCERAGPGAHCVWGPLGKGCDEEEEEEEEEEEDELMLSVATSMSQPHTPPSATAGASFIASRSGGSSIHGMESSDGPGPRLAARRPFAVVGE